MIIWHQKHVFNNPADAADLQLDLTALIDGGVHFVTATNVLEGDGPLVFSCYVNLSGIVNAIIIGSFPNVEAIAPGGNTRLFNQLITQAKECIIPGFRFYQQKFSNELHYVVRDF